MEIHKTILPEEEIIQFITDDGVHKRFFTWQPYAGKWDPDTGGFIINKYLIVWTPVEVPPELVQKPSIISPGPLQIVPKPKK